jgi:hypothetical protein
MLSDLASKKEHSLESSHMTPPLTGPIHEAATKEDVLSRWELNDAGAAYYLKGRSAENMIKLAELHVAADTYKQDACSAFRSAVGLLYARVLDPETSVLWSPAEAARAHMAELDCSAVFASHQYPEQAINTVELMDRVRSAVGKDVQTWGDENNIKVEDDANRLIQDGFAEHAVSLGTALQQSNRAEILNALVANYLFDLRDQKSRAPTNVRGISRQQFTPVTLQATVIIIITSLDVRRFPVKQFIESRLSQWQEKPLGAMYVLSKPVGATIEINGRYAGYTCKTFVLTEGLYHVHISPQCDRDVSVVAGQEPAIVSCSNLQSCSQ